MSDFPRLAKRGGGYSYEGYADLREEETISSTALSVSVTRSDAVLTSRQQLSHQPSSSVARGRHTILLRIHGRRVRRGDHLPSFASQVDQEVMDLLQVWLVHLCRDLPKIRQLL